MEQENDPEKIKKQQALWKMFGRDTKAGKELFDIDLARRHHEAIDRLGVVLGFRTRQRFQLLVAECEVDDQHHAHQQAKQEPDFELQFQCANPYAGIMPKLPFRQAT